MKIQKEKISIEIFDPLKHDWRVTQKIGIAGLIEPTCKATWTTSRTVYVLGPLFAFSVVVSVMTSWTLGLMTFFAQYIGYYVWNVYYHYPKQYYNHVADAYDKFPKYWSQDPKLGNILWVIQYEGSVIATAGVKTNDANQKEITRVGVAKTYQRNGLAQILLEHVLEYCKDQGYEAVVLGLSEQYLKPAFALYAKLGFQKVKGSETFHGLPYFPTLPESSTICTIMMKKYLNNTPT